MVDDKTLQRMKEIARMVKEKAYVPYSHFSLGAALLTAGNNIYGGCNIENASYGLTICAERAAIFKAITAGERDFLALLLLSDMEEPVTPCGACRQVLAEFDPEGNMKIILCSQGEKEIQLSLEELFPLSFNKGDLHK
ncbi:MAG: cytidine deaminase [Halanaerobiales bacterium]